MAKTKSKTGIAGWWDAVSHHPLWAAVIATLLAAAVVAHSGGVFSAGTSAESHRQNVPGKDSQPLRVVWMPEAPENFAVLFNHSISLPKSSEGWRSLHARGGVDVTLSKFRFTLANASRVPVTITNIEAVVTASRPRPVGSEARVYTQGTEGLESFGVMLGNTKPGSGAIFHYVPHDKIYEDADSGEPFFSNHHISLAPNAIYEAKVGVEINISREVEYRFIITGNTAQHGFMYRPRSRFKIVGFNPHDLELTHVYWALPTAPESWCWIHAYKSIGEAKCPLLPSSPRGT